jgi:hypothetical protein
MALVQSVENLQLRLQQENNRTTTTNPPNPTSLASSHYSHPQPVHQHCSPTLHQYPQSFPCDSASDPTRLGLLDGGDTRLLLAG